ncbi:DUF1989 domain-containing protein [Zavarzinia sp.]|uniref:DUF1989 domain-containing protein n=1 Tax=Zavarzinia sp. TaxID=2027920 RepID=UPI003564E635
MSLNALNNEDESDGRYLSVIPARKGIALIMEKGDQIKIVNTYGKQVIDTWAFNAGDLKEYMSMEHSRASMLKIIPGIGDSLVTNKRRPILTVMEDTTPGAHDTLIAACDCYRYQELCGADDHDNCTDNLGVALKALGHERIHTPCPLNLFMNVPVAPDGGIEFVSPTSEAGQYIVLRAEMRLVIAMSACPQDITPVNAMEPCDAHYMIL